jgi:hypothetical protein
MLAGWPVDADPRDEPHGTQHAGEEERCLPAPRDGDDGHCQRRENGADVRARIEDACRERALAPGKPLRNGLDGGGKIPGLTQAEEKARDGETQHAARERMTHRRDAPHADRERIADARAELVDDRSCAQQADRIRRLKRGDDGAVLDLVPAELPPEIRREHAEHLPIDVVQRGGCKQQCADAPAKTPHRGDYRRRLVSLGGDGLHGETGRRRQGACFPRLLSWPSFLACGAQKRPRTPMKYCRPGV